MKSVLFNVAGMSCGGCKSKIEGNLGEQEQISKVSVSLEDKTVLVEGEDTLSNMTLKKDIEELGFSVTGMKKAEVYEPGK